MFIHTEKSYSEELVKKIYELKIGEFTYIEESKEIVRVPGGWVMVCNQSGSTSSVFIPYINMNYA